MKKKIFYLISILYHLVFSCSESCAQTDIHFGPRLALGTRFIIGNNETDLGLGYQVGCMSTIPLKEKLLLQPEIDYSLKGYYLHELGLFGSTTERMNLSYLDINVPISLKLSPAFFLMAGLQTGILLSAQYSTSSDGIGLLSNNTTSTTSPKFEFKKQLHAMDPGALFGFGFQFESGIGLDARANLGFNDVFKTTSGLTNSNYYLNGKNLLCTIGFYYLFNYEKRTTKS